MKKTASKGLKYSEELFNKAWFLVTPMQYNKDIFNNQALK
jgi:hypothetical protein